MRRQNQRAGRPQKMCFPSKKERCRLLLLHTLVAAYRQPVTSVILPKNKPNHRHHRDR